jgi:hypothetical protein
MSSAPEAAAISRACRMRISVSAVGCTTNDGICTLGMVAASFACDDSPDQVESQPREVIVRASPPRPRVRVEWIGKREQRAERPVVGVDREIEVCGIRERAVDRHVLEVHRVPAP